MSILKNWKKFKNQLVLEDRISSSRFCVAITFPMRLGQCFSYFPIYIGNKNEMLQFKWLYWRVAYSFITFTLFLIEFFFVALEAFKGSLNLINIQVVMFHFGALVQFVIFFKMTYNWPNLLKKWAEVEVHMKCYDITENLRLKLKCIASLIMFIAGVEHGLVNAYKLKIYFDADPSYSEAFKSFFTHSYEHIFHIIEYSFGLGLLIQFLNLQRSFYWNYTDVFIMLIGSALTFKLKQITKRIQSASKSKITDVVAWKTIRKDYIRVSELCITMNDTISGTIIVCFLMDLYFVILQLHSSLRPIESVVEKIYFYLSFGLVLMRIFFICIFGGAVYDEWMKIKFYLSTIPTSIYNSEIDRLIDHCASWELCLSGKNFFNISRGLILQMAGAIVTYELVWLQFYGNA